MIKCKVGKKPNIEYFTAFSLVCTRNTVTKIQYCIKLGVCEKEMNKNSCIEEFSKRHERKLMKK